MSRRSAAHPAPKPLDVCSTDAKRHESRHLKKDKRAYAQVYLAQTRIEGIEKWRAAVDAALQAAEGGEQQATDMSRWWAEEDMQQKKTEAAGDGHIEVLEQELIDLVEGVQQKRRGRRHELWKGLRNLFFIF